MSERLDVLLSHSQIHSRIAELARQVESDYEGEEVILVAVLKGCIHFLSDFARELKIDAKLDFMQTSSYGSEKSSSGVVQIRKDLDINIEGLNVIIVEDIVDTGITLSHLRELLLTRKPKSLRVVALLSKSEQRKVFPDVEYLGFEIPDEFVVGYGLDYAERFRNLPYIAVLREG